MNRHLHRRVAGLSKALILATALLLPAVATAHTARVDSFSISPTTVGPGASISFSGKVYGWHCGHNYSGWARIYRGSSASGTALWSKSHSYPSTCGSSSSSGKSYNISGTLTAASTPGTHYFTLRQCSANDSSCATRTVSYSVSNRPPTLTNPGSKTISEGSKLTFTITGADPDGHTLTWNYSGVPSGASISGSGNTKTFTWTPSFSQAGTYNVTFKVTDSWSTPASATRVVQITVTNANQAPTLTDPGNQVVAENQKFSFAIVGADADGDTLTWSYSGVPTGASITGSGNTKTFTWTPSYSQAGTYTVTFTVTDPSKASATRSVKITVSNVNRAPALSNPGNKTVNEGQSLGFTISGSDPDGNTLSWSTSALPGGATVTGSGNVKTFAWTPSFSQAGTYSVVFTVTDNGSPNLSFSRTVKITVVDVNQAPVLTDPGTPTGAETKKLTFTISGSDPDGDTITWAISGVPSGAAVSGSGNVKTFSWTPNYGQAGTHTVIFKVTDNGSPSRSTTRAVKVVIAKTNRAPSLTDPGNKNMSEGQTLVFTITGSDPDNDTLSWSASGMPGGATLTGTGNSRIFTWTPTYTQAGSYSVTFTVTDNGSPKLSASRTVKITVVDANRAPVLSDPGTPAGKEAQPLTFTITGSDPDKDKLTWAYGGIPTGATVTGSGDTKTFSWTPKYGESGTYVMSFTVTDNGSPNRSTSRVVKVVIGATNRAPVLSDPGSQTVKEAQKLAFTVSGSDPDGHALVWSFSGVPSGAYVTGSGNSRTLVWTPTYGQAGSYTVTFKATDTGTPKLSATRAVSIAVTNVNRAPVLSNPGTQSGTENQQLAFIVTGNDADGDTLTWSITGIPSGATVGGSGNTKSFAWTPGYGQSGSYTVTFVVTDSGSPKLSATRKVSIAIGNLNRAPVLTDPGAQSVKEGKPLSFSISGSDADGHSLSWYYSAIPSGAKVTGSGTKKTFSWTPGHDQAGIYVVTFIVIDSGSPSESATRTVTITVGDVNRVPVLSDPGTRTGKEGQQLSFTVTGTDPDGDTLSWTVGGTPSGASVTGSGNTRTVSWTPGYTQAGSYSMTFGVTDSGSPKLSASRTVKIVIGDTNQAPVLSDPGNQTIEEGKQLSFTIKGSDPEKHTLTWSYVGIPKGAAVTGGGDTKTFKWTPAHDQAGLYYVSFTVVDNGTPKRVTSRKVQITVENLNRAPVLSDPGSKAVKEGQQLVFTLSGSDPDKDTLTWTHAGMPKGATFTGGGAGMTFGWTPGHDQAGTHKVTFTVTDSGNPKLSASVTVTITVTDVNRAPVLSDPGNQKVKEAKQLSFTITGSDADGDKLTWNNSVPPAGAKVTANGNTWTFVWTPGYGTKGTYSMTFSVTDSGSPNLTATRKVTIEVGSTNLGAVCNEGGLCDSGFCVDGVCCDKACGGGKSDDCQACSAAAGAATNGVCAPLVKGTVCRATGGLCDEAESCDGSNVACPADGFKKAGEVCRVAADTCDEAESCGGSSATCPTDAYKNSGTVCRAAAGDCDEAESCTGTVVTCPTDNYKAATTVCRQATGVCDLAENCSGLSLDCPKDVFTPNGTPCPSGTCTGGKCLAGPDGGADLGPDGAIPSDAGPDGTEGGVEGGVEGGIESDLGDATTGEGGADEAGPAEAGADAPKTEAGKTDTAGTSEAGGDSAPNNNEGGAPSEAGADAAVEQHPTDDGCSCQLGGDAARTSLLLWLALVVLALRRRRRSS